jgi:hypothetical protein
MVIERLNSNILCQNNANKEQWKWKWNKINVVAKLEV